MLTVRPHAIFNRCPAPGKEVLLTIPQSRDMMLVETMLLIAVMQVVGARRIFEFGTYLGATTLHLALNSPDDAEVFTLDLSPGVQAWHPLDVRLSSDHHAAPTMRYEGSRVAAKIHQLTGESRSIDLAPYFASMDFVFVDGGHDLETVQQDTFNALQMCRPGGCVAWHDYGNPDYPALTGFLDGLGLPCVHVAGTLMVIHFA